MPDVRTRTTVLVLPRRVPPAGALGCGGNGAANVIIIERPASEDCEYIKLDRTQQHLASAEGVTQFQMPSGVTISSFIAVPYVARRSAWLSAPSAAGRKWTLLRKCYNEP
jgi:hypothetical protein